MVVVYWATTTITVAVSVKPPISVAIAVNVSRVPVEKSFINDFTMYISPVLLTAKYVVGKPV